MELPGLTVILNRAASGDADAAAQVWALVYRDVRAMAAASINEESRKYDFEPTMVVHEVYLKLSKRSEARWDSRAHFFGAVARSMEQFLVDAARKFATVKHNARFVDESIALLASELSPTPNPSNANVHFDPADIERLVKALDSLAQISPRAADVFRLRYIFGLSNGAVAGALELTEPEVANLVRFARAFVIAEQRQGERPDA